MFEISPQFISMWEVSNEPWGVKDKTSHYVYANKAYLDLLCLPLKFNIENLLDDSIPHPCAEFAPLFRQQDRRAENTQQRVASLDTHPFGREKIMQPYIFEKFPFYNNKGEGIGSMFHARKCETFPAIFCLDGKPAPRSLTFNPPNDRFSSIELEVIFLALHRLSAKKMGKILACSDRTVKNRLSRIYQNIGVKFLSQLIDFCTEEGFDTYIPPRFLQPSHRLINNNGL